MRLFELAPVWVFQDIVILIATGVLLWFEQRHERYRGQRLVELLGFCFIYAFAFESYGVTSGRYDYGRSILMLGVVPFSVPALEFTVVIVSLRVLEKMQLPVWSRPVLAGFFGMLQDFSLDPLAVRQVFDSEGRQVGRWSWFFAPGDSTILGVPVYNFSGWVVMIGWGAAFILLSRWLHERYPEKMWLRVVAPLAAGVAALIALIMPTTAFVFWLAPFFSQGSRAEWVMLAVHFAVPLTILAVAWRGRMRAAVTLRDDWPVFVLPALFHVVDLTFALAGGFFAIVPLQLAVTALHLGVLAIIWSKGHVKSNASANLAHHVAPA